jgi:hypothetical protein
LWLTAFVIKSFAASRRYIHIDDNELQTSVNWLQSKQLENGCFPVIGTVLHRDLKVHSLLGFAFYWRMEVAICYYSKKLHFTGWIGGKRRKFSTVDGIHINITFGNVY